MKKFFLWPDTHRPWHDEQAVATALAAVKSFRPDIFVIMGDFGDLRILGRYRKRQPLQEALHEEILSIDEGLKQLEHVLPRNCRKIYIEGNHEFRFETYLLNDAPEMYGMWSFDQVLGLKQRGWEWKPYVLGEEGLHLGKLFVCHDVGVAGVYCSRQSLNVQGASVAIGHSHRLQSYYEGTAAGANFVGVSCGWLGNPEAGPFKFLKRSQRRGWQHGFGYGYLWEDGTFQVNLAPIVHGRTIIAGKEVYG